MFGPWGAAFKNNGDGSFALFISDVLGPDSTQYDITIPANIGRVLRYTMYYDESSDSMTFGTDAPSVLASGFMSAPGGIAGGTVGPAGLAHARSNAHLYIADTLGNAIAFVDQSAICTGTSGSRRMLNTPCVLTPLAANGIVSGPIGLALTYDDAKVIAANGLTGDLIEIGATPAGATALFLYLVAFLGLFGTLHSAGLRAIWSWHNPAACASIRHTGRLMPCPLLLSQAASATRSRTAWWTRPLTMAPLSLAWEIFSMCCCCRGLRPPLPALCCSWTTTKTTCRRCSKSERGGAAGSDGQAQWQLYFIVADNCNSHQQCTRSACFCVLF